MQVIYKNGNKENRETIKGVNMNLVDDIEIFGMDEHPCTGCRYEKECPAANCCERFRAYGLGRPWKDIGGLE